MNNSQELATLIKKLAKSKNIPIRKMLTDCNLSINTLSSMKSGGYYPRLDTAAKIADYLNCSVDYLLGRTDNPALNDVDENHHDESQVLSSKNPVNVVIQDFSGQKEKAPSLSDEAMNVAHDYSNLDKHGRYITRAVIDAEKQRIQNETVPEEKPAVKVIPLFDNPAAAGTGAPSFGDDYTNYEVPADSPADFAFKVQGDSMEPYLKDGSVALAQRKRLDDGEVGVFVLDGEMFCKQFCMDHMGNVYLFSLNRRRKDADQTIWHDSGRGLYYVGKVLMDKRIPLPND